MSNHPTQRTCLYIKHPETWPEFNKPIFLRAICLSGHPRQATLNEHEPVVLCYIRWFYVIVMKQNGETVKFRPSHFRLEWRYCNHDFEFGDGTILDPKPPKKNWLSKLLGL